MPHEVVDVAGDPAPLDQQRLLRELAPGGLELGDELGLARGRAAEEPREDDAEDPDAHVEISDGSWITVAATGASSGEQAQRHGRGGGRAARATTNASSETSNSSGSSCPERWATTAGTITASDSASSGRPGHVGPQDERRGREPAEHEIRAG